MAQSIATFITARLHAEEALALAAAQGPWCLSTPDWDEVHSADGRAVIAGGRWGGEAGVFDDSADAIHVAYQDPTHVLLAVSSTRGLLNAAGGDLVLLRLLAMRWADHPTYDQAWAPDRQ